MGRTKKQPSVIQTDSTLFKPLVEQIRTVGVLPFSVHVSVDRRTIYNWMNGESVEPTSEEKILNGIEDFAIKMDQDTKTLLTLSRIARKKHGASV